MDLLAHDTLTRLLRDLPCDEPEYAVLHI